MIPRVLVVDDSPYIRLAVARALRLGGVEVAGFAKDGVEAVARNLELEPDAVVLDLQMPNMNGVEALREIQRTRPVPVIVFASMSADGAQLAVQALAEGAMDVLPKAQASELALDLAARVWSVAVPQHGEGKPPGPPGSSGHPRVVVVGTSTGGPPCVEMLLRALPADFPLPVVVAQHMAQGFTRAFAERLAHLCQVEVFEGYDGARVGPGDACILPGGMVSALAAPASEDRDSHVFGLTVRRDTTLPGAKPNASVLFLSALGAAEGRVCALVMTGMGADGADAVPALRAAGAYIVAQDPEDAVIPSMPNAAIAAGATHVRSVDEMVPFLTHILGREAVTRP